MKMEPQSSTLPIVAKQDTSGEASTSPASAKAAQGFSDLSHHDMVGMIVATAYEAQRAGLPLVAKVGERNGQKGIMLFIPDFIIQNGAVVVAK